MARQKEAREAVKEITRDEVFELMKDAKRLRTNEKNHIRQSLEMKYPGLETTTVRRNGQMYNALDYLFDDVASYGPDDKK